MAPAAVAESLAAEAWAAENGDQFVGYLALRPADASRRLAEDGWNPLALVLLLPKEGAFEWDGAGMLVQFQATLKARRGSGSEAERDGDLDKESQVEEDLVSLQLQEAWPGHRAWAPDKLQLAQIRSFSCEIWELLSPEPAPPQKLGSNHLGEPLPKFLIAPLKEDWTKLVPATPCGSAWAASNIDWEVIRSIASLREARASKGSWSPSESAADCSLLQLSKLAVGSSMSCAASSRWLQCLIEQPQHQSDFRHDSQDRARTTPCNEPAGLGLLALASYSLRSHRIVRAWPQRLAAEESVIPPKRRGRQCPVPGGPGSLAAFYQERYGLQISDAGQCVLEAADGACVRPPVLTGEKMLLLSRFLKEPHQHSGTHHSPSREDAQPDSVSRPSSPGPIRLLPEFLIRHPLPQRFLVAVSLLPLIISKVQRLQVVAKLRNCIFTALHLRAGAVPVLHPGVATPGPVFQHPVGYVPGRRHALMLERGLAAALQKELLSVKDAPKPPDANQAKQIEEITGKEQHQRSANVLLAAKSAVEIAWALEVATTLPSASEPYDLGRLAWFGDTALFFVTVVWLLKTSFASPNMNLAQLKSRAGRLISNKHLGITAQSFPLNLQNFLAFAPSAATAPAHFWNLPTQENDPPSRTSQDNMGKKATADSMEAVIGAVVVIGGLSTCFRLLGWLPWWLEDGATRERSSVSEDSGEATGSSYCGKVRWMGMAALRLHGSAWLLSRHPELGRDGLSEKRPLLLDSDWPEASTPEDTTRLLSCLTRLLQLSLSAHALSDREAVCEQPSEFEEAAVASDLAAAALQVVNGQGWHASVADEQPAGMDKANSLQPPLPVVLELLVGAACLLGVPLGEVFAPLSDFWEMVTVNLCASDVSGPAPNAQHKTSMIT
ncbi:unnamed protein product [Polarella glacialis]|uniref:RNase III domain-containing protein n=1 Tax=Polarella glacialis TaxID=89957 RepID=A0A813K255_POLGL|nr:unnamed protein product [Polarella glacialis]